MIAGWMGMLLGLISGAVIGLFFHRVDFAGGYAALRRRMLRLGHIAFFALGMLNVIFALSWSSQAVAVPHPALASQSLIIGAMLMPVNCFLTAWREAFRHLFAIPVILVAMPIVSVLMGLLSS